MWKYTSGVCSWGLLKIVVLYNCEQKVQNIYAILANLVLRNLPEIAKGTFSRSHWLQDSIHMKTCWAVLLSDTERGFFQKLIKTVQTHQFPVFWCYNFTWEQIWHLAEAGALTSSRTLQTPRIHTISPTKHLSRVSSTCERRFIAAKKHKAEEWGSHLRGFLSP